jgi:hypothetical protein
MVLPSALNPASASQIGNKRLGLVQRNCFSRLRTRWSSSQVLSLGPKVAGRGDGSRIVRCNPPAGLTLLLTEGESCENGCGGEERVHGVSTRLHSFKIVGIEEADRRVASEKAWMEVKMLLA